MNLRLALVSSLCLAALAGCGQRDATGTAQPAAATEPASAAASAGDDQGRLTADDIARIKAAGRTGIWADRTDLCNRGNRVTLTWNATGQADKVVVMLVNRKGNERLFGSGAGIGRKQTGKWVRPGMSFKLLNASDRAELGSVAFTEKQCG